MLFVYFPVSFAAISLQIEAAILAGSERFLGLPTDNLLLYDFERIGMKEGDLVFSGSLCSSCWVFVGAALGRGCSKAISVPLMELPWCKALFTCNSFQKSFILKHGAFHTRLTETLYKSLSSSSLNKSNYHLTSSSRAFLHLDFGQQPSLFPWQPHTALSHSVPSAHPRECLDSPQTFWIHVFQAKQEYFHISHISNNSAFM